MKRLLATLAVAMMLVGLYAVPASADSDTATIDFSINAVTSITFTDDSANFGPLSPGTSTDQMDTLAYTVSDNTGGFDVDIALTSGSCESVRGNVLLDSGSVGALGNDPSGQGSFDSCGSTIGLVFNNWRTEVASGLYNYTDDVRVDTAANAPSGANPTITLTYTAA